MPGENIWSWSTTAASNANSDVSINYAEGMARAAVNDSARSEMASIAKWRDLTNGSKTTTGSANAQVVTTGMSFSTIPTGMRILVKNGFSNTASTTLILDSAGPTTIKSANLADLRGGELVADGYGEYIYNGTNWLLLNGQFLPDAPVFPGLIYGLTLSNNVADATNDIDIAAGRATDGALAATMVLTTALTKRLDAVWVVGTNQGGLDTGVIANGTYHAFLIRRSDTGVTDILFSASATAPTMPASYDQKRRIGSILRESATIVPFSQLGDEFLRKARIQDLTTANPGAVAVTRTLSVPTGVQVWAKVMLGLQNSGSAVNFSMFLSELDRNDEATSTNFSTASQTCNVAGGTSTTSAQAIIRTNTSAQIRSRGSITDANCIVTIWSLGWIDRRDQNG